MKRTTILAVGVAVALLTFVVLSQRRPAERGMSRLSFTSISVDAIDELEVGGTNAVKLVRDGKLWRIAQGKEADGAAIERALEQLSKVDTTDVVTMNAERFAELEVDEAKGVRVQARATGKAVADLVIGKGASGGSYVKHGDTVYVAKGLHVGSFSRAPSTWLEKRMTKRDANDLTKLEVSGAGEPYTLTKDGERWTLAEGTPTPAGFRFDATIARTMANSAAGLRAKDVLDADPGVGTTGLDAGAVRIKLTFKPAIEGAAADEVTLTLGSARAEDKAVFATTSLRQDVFTVLPASAQMLKRSVAELRDLSVLSFELTKARRLVIVDGARRLQLDKKDGAWKLGPSTEKPSKDFELDPMLVDRRLSALLGTKGTKLADGVTPMQAGVARASQKAMVILEDGKEVVLAFGKTEKDADGRELVHAQGNATSDVVLVTSFQRNNLLGGLDSFQKRADAQGFGGGMPNLDPKALEQLPPEVRAGLMKQIQQKQREAQLMQQLQAQGAK